MRYFLRGMWFYRLTIVGNASLRYLFLIRFRPYGNCVPVSTAPQPKETLILIVDDDKDSAESLGMLLSIHGFAYMTARSADEVVLILKHVTPVVIILDIRMPKEDGWQLANRLRHLYHPKPRLIAHSGLGRAEDRQRSLDSGFDYHFTKPADPLLMVGLISFYMGRRKTTPQKVVKEHDSSRNGRGNVKVYGSAHLPSSRQ